MNEKINTIIFWFTLKFLCTDCGFFFFTFTGNFPEHYNILYINMDWITFWYLTVNEKTHMLLFSDISNMHFVSFILYFHVLKV